MGRKYKEGRLCYVLHQYKGKKDTVLNTAGHDYTVNGVSISSSQNAVNLSDLNHLLDPVISSVKETGKIIQNTVRDVKKETSKIGH